MSSINKCPKCGYSSDMAFEECPKCGLVIEKFMKIENSKKRQKRIEELERELNTLKIKYAPSKESQFLKRVKFYAEYNSITKFIFVFAVLFILSLPALIFRESKTSNGHAYVYNCMGYYKEMERADHAYLYGGGTKAEFEKARRRWQECVLRNK